MYPSPPVPSPPPPPDPQCADKLLMCCKSALRIFRSDFDIHLLFPPFPPPSPCSPLSLPEFRDASLMLNAKNERPIRAGMTFNVSLGLHDLLNEAPGAADNPKLRTYSLLLADTVVVRGAADRDKWVDVATASASKAFSDVAYTLKVSAAEGWSHGGPCGGWEEGGETLDWDAGIIA